MKKCTSIIISIILLVTLLPFSADASNTIQNVYDAQSFSKYLETAGADIVLWNDISFSSAATTIQCNSIDLNGYQLDYNSTMTMGSEVESFTILDSTYNSSSDSNSGKFIAVNGIDISSSAFIIESGVVDVSNGVYGTGDLKIMGGDITICGTVGQDGADGVDGANGTSFSGIKAGSEKSGGVGIAGSNGGHGIDVSNVFIYGGKSTIIGGNGGNGGYIGVGGTYGKDGCCRWRCYC